MKNRKLYKVKRTDVTLFVLCCHDCDRPATDNDVGKSWTEELRDLDPGNAEVGPQPDIACVYLCPKCANTGEKTMKMKTTAPAGITITEVEASSKTDIRISYKIGKLEKEEVVHAKLNRVSETLSLSKYGNSANSIAMDVLGLSLTDIVASVTAADAEALCDKYETDEKARKLKEAQEAWDKDPMHVIMKWLTKDTMVDKGIHCTLDPATRDEVNEHFDKCTIDVVMETGADTSANLIIRTAYLDAGSKYHYKRGERYWDIVRSYKSIGRPRKTSSLVKKLVKIQEDETARKKLEASRAKAKDNSIAAALKDLKSLGASHKEESRYSTFTKRSTYYNTYPAAGNMVFSPCHSPEGDAKYSVSIKGAYTAKELKAIQAAVNKVLAARSTETA